MTAPACNLYGTRAAAVAEKDGGPEGRARTSTGGCAEVRPAALTRTLKEKARSLGCDLVGIARADRFDCAVEARRRVDAGLVPPDAARGHEAYRDAALWERPDAAFNGAASVVCVGVSCRAPEAPRSRGAGPFGRIARHHRHGYYASVQRILASLRAFATSSGAACSAVAPQALPLKAAAARAGIGWFGKHSLLVTEAYGSWVVLGALVIGAELEPDRPSDRSCGNCDACIRACPAGAIVEPYVIDLSRCIAYLLESTRLIPREIRRLVGTRINGCDDCQEACPKNKRAGLSSSSMRLDDPAAPYGAYPELLPLLKLTQEQFERSFAHLDWLEPDVKYLKRNVVIALGNSGDRGVVGRLSDLVRTGDPMLRSYSAWALGELGGRRASVALERALASETDAACASEIRHALERCTSGI